ncbi:tRNA lysidine(34) synthetase TilS [Lachnoclostridium phocaeense]|uniref:tRNA lysidine(34) synthetase TilS n=1 Tax=Lachnoclostridium phocaeense TaxID=1871021 RepID=UPI00248E0A4D|nr:tRNA lysidine(34) synthetase TilS [Lachnoclostridium phocaeense]
MYEKIRDYVRAHGMLDKGDVVIAGISGGADSVCLLCVLLELRKEYDLSVRAVHVNHGIRGEAAAADQAYVEEMCREVKVPLDVVHVDVCRMAREEGMTQEEAGRIARRRAFEEAAVRWSAGRIALAHHKNDNAETVLLNLARGTGLRGMGGIRPCSGKYIRPLLDTSREEIEAFLDQKNISYCMDATNYEDTYTRNRIRNHIIPYMEEQVNSRFVDHVCGTAGQLARLWEYVERQTDEAAAGLTSLREGEDGQGREMVIDGQGFARTDTALRPYILKWVLEQVSGRAKDLETVHFDDLEELFDRQVGRRISLPYGMKAYRCYEGVRVVSSDWKPPREEENEVWDKDRIKMRILDPADIDGPALEAIPKTPYTKWFDYDIIENSVTIRTRRPGDYLVIGRDGATQKLNRYFINEKIPSRERDRILLAADGSRIMWVIGYRRGQGYEVTGQTKKILEITIDKGGKYDGRDN